MRSSTASQAILAVVIMAAAAKMLWRVRGPGGLDDATRNAPWPTAPAPAAPPQDASVTAWGSQPIPIPAWAGGATASGFGDKCQWLAVKTAKPETVARFLKLRRLKRSNWKDGVDAAYEDEEKIFVTPAIDGWVLALDPRFAGREGEAFDKPDLAGQWSKALGAPVQVYVSDRRSGSYGWIKADKGKLIRFFMEAEGKVVANVGPETPDEKELRAAVRAHPSPELEEVADLLFRLAARWSLDPNTLDQRTDLPASGLLGEPPSPG
jgi:hypothetical protein